MRVKVLLLEIAITTSSTSCEYGSVLYASTSPMCVVVAQYCILAGEHARADLRESTDHTISRQGELSQWFSASHLGGCRDSRIMHRLLSAAHLPQRTSQSRGTSQRRPDADRDCMWQDRSERQYTLAAIARWQFRGIPARA